MNAVANDAANRPTDAGQEFPPLLTVSGLKKYFPIRKTGWGRDQHLLLKAVDDVSFTVGRGETLGLVGESGCGKTTTGRLILRLLEPTAGSVHLDGSPDLMQLSAREWLPYRRRVQMIFQDPYSSLNPRMSIGSIVGEALTIHGLAKGRRAERVAELLEDCGLPPRRRAPLSPRAFRRSAPARRHRPGAGR